MASTKRFHGAQIPVILTVLLLVGTAWSWVAEMNRTKASENVATELANFALEGESGSEKASIPACCMTLDQAQSAEAALIASKKEGCGACPGSGTSLSVAEGSAPACCSGSSKAVAKTGESGCCMESTGAVAKTESIGDSSCCMKSTTTVAEAAEEKPACCAGSSTSKTVSAETGELDPETEALIATVKIPQAER